MEKRYVLITGASSGIGLDACRYLLEKGYQVIGTVRKSEDKQKLEARFNMHFEAMILDVCDDLSIEGLRKRLTEKLKDNGLYGLVNNAGIATGGPLMHVKPATFQLQMDTNVNSIFKLTNALLPLMGAGFDNPYDAGRIINISSVSGLINSPMLGPYCISKHSLESMSDIYRRELAVYDIKVILIEPGPIRTPIWGKSVPKSNPYEDTDFRNFYHDFRKRVKRSEEKALPVEKVSKYIYKALYVNRPANRYLVSRNKWMVRFIHKCVPSKMLDYFFVKTIKSSILPDD